MQYRYRTGWSGELSACRNPRAQLRQRTVAQQHAKAPPNKASVQRHACCLRVLTVRHTALEAASLVGLGA